MLYSTFITLSLASLGAFANPIDISPRAAFTKSNGQAAKALNAKFAKLTKNSPCKPGENACVGGQFAQCANGKFVTFPCAAGLTCQALPLVNSPGTSITCDTKADAATRIKNTGAKRSYNFLMESRPLGRRQSDGFVPTAQDIANGAAATVLNGQFLLLNASSPCTEGENACVKGDFAQCVFGKFVLTPCPASTRCEALPNINSPGTSITCDLVPDAAQRIVVDNSPSKKKRAAFTQANGEAANALNAHFATLTPSSPCTPGENACVNGEFAQCANGVFVTFPCNAGLTCQALPLVNSPGTSIACDTAADAAARVAATGA